MMTKTIPLIIITIVLVGCTSLETSSKPDCPVKVTGMTVLEFNNVLDRFVDTDIRFYVDKSNSHLRLLHEGILPEYTNVYMSREELLIALDKFIEWEETAKLNQMELHKKIASWNTYVNFLYNDEWHKDPLVPFNAIFFSQNLNLHQLILRTDRFTSTTNEFISGRIEGLYINLEEAQYLKEVLLESQASVDKYIADQEKATEFK